MLGLSHWVFVSVFLLNRQETHGHWTSEQYYTLCVWRGVRVLSYLVPPRIRVVQFYFWQSFTWAKLSSKLDPISYRRNGMTNACVRSLSCTRRWIHTRLAQFWCAHNVKRRRTRHSIKHNQIKQQTKKFIRKTFAFNYIYAYTESALSPCAALGIFSFKCSSRDEDMLSFGT